MSPHIAQILGISSSLFLSGSTFTYSYSTIPAVSLAVKNPSLARQQWKKLYSLGKLTGISLALISAGSFGWAWMHTGKVPYLVATALSIANIPWTLIVMMRTNNSIATSGPYEITEADEAVVVKKLLDKWAMMNFVRVLFPLVGGLVGLATALP